VRYADDCNVYVESRRAPERVMAGLVGLYARLKLQINPAKSAVAPVADRTFLGYRFWRVGRGRIVKRRVAPKAIDKMKARVRELTARSNGRSIKQCITALRRYLLGWQAYFRLAETPSVFAELDGWIRRRLRALIIKQCKHGPRLFQVLRARGATKISPTPYPD
jgi:RNA-directed DNA polymerase